jgi:NTE family protein
MKNALVLSGGGSKGAFQVGAITRWIEKGIDFDVVSGVSVGSLNGSMVAQGKIDEMIKVWNTVNDDKIYRHFSTLRAAWRVVTGKDSNYDASPLYKLLQENIYKCDFKKKFFIGLTSLDSGEYKGLTVDDLETDKDVRDAVFASALMPILWAPVDVKTTSGIITQAVDGGLRNVTPLSDVLDELPDHIYIISCNRFGGVVDHAKPSGVVNIAKRVFLDIMLSEVVDNDVKLLLLINDFVLQAAKGGVELVHPGSKKVMKYFKVTVVEPPYKIGDPIKFDQPTIQANIKLGYDMAK